MGFKLNLFSSLFIFLFFLLSCNSSEPLDTVTVKNPFIIESSSNFANIAHRGGIELFPEETLLAMEHAIKVGADFLEMDIRLTRDNKLVLHHDKRINRTSDGDGLVNNYSLKELKKINFGYNYSNKQQFPYRKKTIKIATLEEVFLTFSNQNMIIEIKDTGNLGKKSSLLLKGLISKHNMKNKVVIASFDNATIKYFVKITDNKIPVIASMFESIIFYLSTVLKMDFLYTPRAKILAFSKSIIGIDLTNRNIINNAHRRNLAIYYWGINDSKTMKILIKKNADGIMTDYPSQLEKIKNK